MREGATITVGYDGSRCARRALDWATAELATRGGTVRIVACYTMPVTAEPWYVPAPIDLDVVRADAVRRADQIAAAYRDTHPSVRFEGTATLGPAVDRLVVESAESDLLVVGTHGHSPFDAWRLGSVAHGVTRHATCPVVVVPDAKPRPRHDRLVTGVDGSGASLAALRWACDEADDRDAELVVLHAWDYPYSTELGSPTSRDMTRVDAALELEAAARTARERRGGTVEERLIEGRAASELIEAARDADLVVVGSRGRGVVRALLFGSVSREVSARASCPTVIVRGDTAADQP